jgi:hypothetical protein
MRPLGQLSQARAPDGNMNPYARVKRARLKTVARTAIFLFRLLICPNLCFRGPPCDGCLCDSAGVVRGVDPG